jgi:hypothetical protein
MIQPSTSVVRMFTRSPDFQVVRHEQYQEQERRRETLHEPDQTSAFMGEAKKIECEAITGKPAVSLRGLRADCEGHYVWSFGKGRVRWQTKPMKTDARSHGGRSCLRRSA